MEEGVGGAKETEWSVVLGNDGNVLDSEARGDRVVTVKDVNSFLNLTVLGDH